MAHRKLKDFEIRKLVFPFNALRIVNNSVLIIEIDCLDDCINFGT